MQALENVAGVNQVSEGQAAVPAFRGLARGRTLILIDGARVSSERRVGPSATYLDPDVIEGVEVARGPGSVAYGSDAFGGVISVRTRSVAPQAPFSARFSRHAWRRYSRSPCRDRDVDGFSRGSVLFAAHTRDVEDYDGPDDEVFNSGYADHGFLGARHATNWAQGCCRPAGRATSVATSSGPATTRGPSASSIQPRTRTG